MDSERLRLPPAISFSIILAANFLFNVSFFVIVPSATAYARHLGGGSLFGGLTIGIVTFSSIILLFPMSRMALFKWRYRPSLHVACLSMIIGNALYAIADLAGSLILILVGRAIGGIGFTGWFFVKRYCTDSRIVGLARRTMCTSFLVLSQTLGMVVGPILGGQLSKLNWRTAGPLTRVFNANTNPGWLMVLAWIVFWIIMQFLFEEVEQPNQQELVLTEVSTTSPNTFPASKLTARDIAVCLVMSYAAFTVFFELGSWESEIPIFGKKHFGYNAWESGNFIGLVGLGSVVLVGGMPFLIPMIQDRIWISIGLFVGILGCGLNILLLGLRKTTVIWYGCQWFLVCAGFNSASIITLSLMSKSLPDSLSDKTALVVQLSNYTGRLLGAIWGAAGPTVGDTGVAGGQVGVAVVAILAIAITWNWLKAQTG